VIPEAPDAEHCFAVSSSVEHPEDKTVITFHLNAPQMTTLKSVAPKLFPTYTAGSRVRRGSPEFVSTPVRLQVNDREHHVLCVASEQFYEGQESTGPPSFVPIVEEGVWQDDGFTCYLDQQLTFHKEPPEPPYLRLARKQIEGRNSFMVWELEDESAMETYMEWVEERKRREFLKSN
jgi:hypothetical protein